MAPQNPSDHHPLDPHLRESLAAALEFYRHIGVESALDDHPHDRFAESAAPPRVEAQPAQTLSRAEARSPVTSDPPKRMETRAKPTAALAAGAGEIAASAAELASGAQTLDELRARLDAFEGCALKATATRLVFADGNPNARLMLVGEAPGADEDREGRPFVGRAGQLLDKMLAAIGLDRTHVYISNIVPWRPPGNRTPTPLEIAACLPFTRRQIALVNPDILVCVGAPSMQALFNVKDGILKMRGRWTEIEGQTSEGQAKKIHATALLHPAFLLRQPLQKRLAWRDLRALRRVYDGQTPPA